ncbi:MAG: hypothetical protein QXT56_01450 [Candidatus Nitrosocaldus sp.]
MVVYISYCYTRRRKGMPIEIICSKCGALLSTISILKPVKDIMKNGNRCPSCGTLLLPDFVIEVTRF